MISRQSHTPRSSKSVASTALGTAGQTARASSEFASGIMGKYGFGRSPYLGLLALIFRQNGILGEDELAPLAGEGEKEWIVRLELQLNSLQQPDATHLLTRRETIHRLEQWVRRYGGPEALIRQVQKAAESRAATLDAGNRTESRDEPEQGSSQSLVVDKQHTTESSNSQIEIAGTAQEEGKAARKKRNQVNETLTGAEAAQQEAAKAKPTAHTQKFQDMSPDAQQQRTGQQAKGSTQRGMLQWSSDQRPPARTVHRYQAATTFDNQQGRPLAQRAMAQLMASARMLSRQADRFSKASSKKTATARLYDMFFSSQPARAQARRMISLAAARPESDSITPALGQGRYERVIRHQGDSARPIVLRRWEISVSQEQAYVMNHVEAVRKASRWLRQVQEQASPAFVIPEGVENSAARADGGHPQGAASIRLGEGPFSARSAEAFTPLLKGLMLRHFAGPSEELESSRSSGSSGGRNVQSAHLLHRSQAEAGAEGEGDQAGGTAARASANRASSRSAAFSGDEQVGRGAASGTKPGSIAASLGQRSLAEPSSVSAIQAANRTTAVPHSMRQSGKWESAASTSIEQDNTPLSVIWRKTAEPGQARLADSQSVRNVAKITTVEADQPSVMEGQRPRGTIGRMSASGDEKAESASLSTSIARSWSIQSVPIRVRLAQEAARQAGRGSVADNASAPARQQESRQDDAPIVGSWAAPLRTVHRARSAAGSKPEAGAGSLPSRGTTDANAASKHSGRADEARSRVQRPVPKIQSNDAMLNSLIQSKGNMSASAGTSASASASTGVSTITHPSISRFSRSDAAWMMVANQGKVGEGTIGESGRESALSANNARMVDSIARRTQIARTGAQSIAVRSMGSRTVQDDSGSIKSGSANRAAQPSAFVQRRAASSTDEIEHIEIRQGSERSVNTKGDIGPQHDRAAANSRASSAVGNDTDAASTNQSAKASASADRLASRSDAASTSEVSGQAADTSVPGASRIANARASATASTRGQLHGDDALSGTILRKIITLENTGAHVRASAMTSTKWFTKLQARAEANEKAVDTAKVIGQANMHAGVDRDDARNRPGISFAAVRLTNLARRNQVPSQEPVAETKPTGSQAEASKPSYMRARISQPDRMSASSSSRVRGDGSSGEATRLQLKAVSASNTASTIRIASVNLAFLAGFFSRHGGASAGILADMNPLVQRDLPKDLGSSERAAYSGGLIQRSRWSGGRMSGDHEGLVGRRKPQVLPNTMETTPLPSTEAAVTAQRISIKEQRQEAAERGSAERDSFARGYMASRSELQASLADQVSGKLTNQDAEQGSLGTTAQDAEKVMLRNRPQLLSAEQGERAAEAAAPAARGSVEPVETVQRRLPPEGSSGETGGEGADAGAAAARPVQAAESRRESAQAGLTAAVQPMRTFAPTLAGAGTPQSAGGRSGSLRVQSAALEHSRAQRQRSRPSRPAAAGRAAAPPSGARSAPAAVGSQPLRLTQRAMITLAGRAGALGAAPASRAAASQAAAGSAGSAANARASTAAATQPAAVMTPAARGTGGVTAAGAWPSASLAASSGGATAAAGIRPLPPMVQRQGIPAVPAAGTAASAAGAPIWGAPTASAAAQHALEHVRSPQEHPAPATAAVRLEHKQQAPAAATISALAEAPLEMDWLRRSSSSDEPPVAAVPEQQAAPQVDMEQLQELMKQLPQLDIKKIADKVYREIEKRMKFERQRRGL